MLLVDDFTIFWFYFYQDFLFFNNLFLYIIILAGENLGNMAEARRKMHERDEREKKENKSEVKKIRNFFFGCCNNKESKKVKEHK